LSALKLSILWFDLEILNLKVIFFAAMTKDEKQSKANLNFKAEKKERKITC
jgi:hypothetical protein